jgi:uncharacterized protein (TIGR03083 family)
MAKGSPWPTIHAERQALADDLGPIGDAQWATPSLSAPWSVRDVLGHMTATARMTPPKFFASMIGSGFRFNAMAAKGIAQETNGAPGDTLARFREQVSATTHPPGPVDSWLGETIVHGEDIRRPLGITHTYPTEALTRLADFYRGSNVLIGGKKRVAGLTLRATDTGWSAGEGPEVSGPMLAILLVITGRQVGLDELSGDGVAVLRERM